MMQKDQMAQEGDESQERFQMLGFGSMRQLHEAR